jgi:hypothetical protein
MGRTSIWHRGAALHRAPHCRMTFHGSSFCLRGEYMNEESSKLGTSTNLVQQFLSNFFINFDKLGLPNE